VRGRRAARRVLGRGRRTRVQPRPVGLRQSSRAEPGARLHPKGRTVQRPHPCGPRRQEMKAFRVALVAVGVALGVVVYWIQVDNIDSPAARAAATVVVAWAFLGAGLLAWSRRPGNQVGPLMTA